MNWNGFIYHYLFNFSEVNKILKSNKLFSINILKDPEIVKFYSNLATSKKLKGVSKENSDIENAEIFWEYFYNKFYRDILNKPYSNYGIYMTTIDLFSFDCGLDLKYRFRFSYNDIKGKDIIISISGKAKKVNSINDIKLAADIYSNNKLVERIWNTSNKFKFKRLPQIIVFSDYLKVNKSMLEKRNGDNQI